MGVERVESFPVSYCRNWAGRTAATCASRLGGPEQCRRRSQIHGETSCARAGQSVGRRTGRGELDEHAEGVHFSEIEVDLRRSARSRTEVVADICSCLAVLPASLNVGQPNSHRLEHMLSGIRAEVDCKIYGDDLDDARNLAETLRDQLASVPGLAQMQRMTAERGDDPSKVKLPPGAARSPPHHALGPVGAAH